MMTRDRTTEAKQKVEEYGRQAIISVVIVGLFQIIMALLPDDSDKADKILEAIRLSDQNAVNRHIQLIDWLSRRPSALVPPAGIDYEEWLSYQPYAGDEP